ncbi:MAG TPA: hypothetical protein PKI11_18520 [Candidatus Hydrogenedentes bacterium]|nr:hypothetical protein [Candidatus Hydrogenedentota bacterium]
MTTFTLRMLIAMLAALLVGTDAAFAETVAPEPADEVVRPSADPCETCRIEEWEGPLNDVRGQLNLLQLLARATSFGGMTIKVPREVQRIPLEKMEGTEDLVRMGIKLYLKEVRLRDFKINHDTAPQWLHDRPLLGTLAQFGRLGVSVDAQTRVGTFPVKCDLTQGAMPVDFHCKQGGYELGVAPPYRAEEARIEEVSLDLGGPIASGVLTRVFGQKVARLVLEAAAGQTLQLDQETLLGGAGVGSLLKNAPQVPEGVGALIEGLL